MAQFLGSAFQQALNASAVPYSGGLMYVYLPSTTTLVSLFSDEALLTPAANPMVADSSGSFTPVFLDETSVKLVLQTSAGVTVRTIDPAYTTGVANVISATDVTYSGGTSGLASENVQDAIDEVVALQSTSQSWTSASDGPIATGTSTNAGAAAGPLVEMYRNSASPAASDVIGGLRLTGKNSAATKETYAQIHGVITDTTNGSEDAKIVFQTDVAGALADRLHVGAGVWGDGATGGDPGTGKANFTEIRQDGTAVRPLISGTAQATTSGTSIDFSSIPSWVKRITIMIAGVSTNGTSIPMIQLGDAGGIEATGYAGTISLVSGGSTSSDLFSTGFLLDRSHAASVVLEGSVALTLLDAATFTWTCTGITGWSNAASAHFGGGSKSLSAALDRIRLTTVNGTDTFDAGKINIMYE